MSLATWFKRALAGGASPRLQTLLADVVAYLKSRPTDEEIVPKIVGKVIGESELAAMTALSMLERHGITKHHFGVYCGIYDVPLDTFDDLSDVKDSFDCKNCDKRHSASQGTCKVEVYYTVNRDLLGNFATGRSAA